MKTIKRNNQTLPSPFRVSLYLFAVAVFCFINWTAIHAENPVDGEVASIEQRLAAALVPVAEPELVLEDWMLTLTDDCEAAPMEETVALEDWMLNFSDDNEVAHTEGAIALEDWMLTFADDCEAVPVEETVALEDWMLNFSDGPFAEGIDPEIEVEPWMVDRNEFLSAPETEITLEDWMVEVSSWNGPVFLVNK